MTAPQSQSNAMPSHESCFYCGGRHPTRLCPGYHARGLRNDVGELQGAVDSLAKLSDARLGDIRSAVDQFSESAQQDAGEVRGLLGSVNESIADVDASVGELADVSREGFSTLDRNISAGFGSVTGSLGALIGVISIGFIGLSAMLAYRELNDSARHAKLMAHHSENSSAARARRALQLALTHSDLGRYPEALVQVQAAIQYYPTWAESHRVESVVRGQSGDMHGALGASETALALLNRGEDQPSEFVRGATDLHRLRRVVVLQAAATLAASERLPEAISCLRKELDQRPDHHELWHEIGRLLALSGNENDAHDSLVRAVLASTKLYGMVAVDPQLSGARLLVDSVLREARARKLQELEALECTWMALRGPGGIEQVVEIGRDVTYAALSDRAQLIRNLLAGRT